MKKKELEEILPGSVYMPQTQSEYIDTIERTWKKGQTTGIYVGIFYSSMAIGCLMAADMIHERIDALRYERQRKQYSINHSENNYATSIKDNLQELGVLVQ